jgi:hypothetical protein
MTHVFIREKRRTSSWLFFSSSASFCETDIILFESESFIMQTHSLSCVSSDLISHIHRFSLRRNVKWNWCRNKDKWRKIREIFYFEMVDWSGMKRDLHTCTFQSNKTGPLFGRLDPFY